MRFHTKKYDIKKCDPEEFSDAKYEINLKDGYKFDDGTSLNYASDFEDLKTLISEITSDIK